MVILIVVSLTLAFINYSSFYFSISYFSLFSLRPSSLLSSLSSSSLVSELYILLIDPLSLILWVKFFVISFFVWVSGEFFKSKFISRLLFPNTSKLLTFLLAVLLLLVLLLLFSILLESSLFLSLYSTVFVRISVDFLVRNNLLLISLFGYFCKLKWSFLAYLCNLALNLFGGGKTYYSDY